MVLKLYKSRKTVRVFSILQCRGCFCRGEIKSRIRPFSLAWEMDGTRSSWSRDCTPIVSTATQKLKRGKRGVVFFLRFMKVILFYRQKWPFWHAWDMRRFLWRMTDLFLINILILSLPTNLA